MAIEARKTGRSGGRIAPEAMTVIGAQSQPRGRTPKHKWVFNPWRLEFDSSETLDPGAVRIDLPKSEGPYLVGASDPWFEFASARIISANVGRGTIRRYPATLGPALDEASQPFLLDRGDGYRAPPRQSAPTFLL